MNLETKVVVRPDELTRVVTRVVRHTGSATPKWSWCLSGLSLYRVSCRASCLLFFHAGTRPNLPCTHAREMQTPSLEVTATKPLTFWFSDLHDGTRVDHPSILLDLGHKVIMAGSKSGHTIAPWVFERSGLQVLPSSGVSDLIKHHTSHSKPLDEQRVYEQFLQYARGGAQSSLMATVSAFVCSFPASLCEA